MCRLAAFESVRVLIVEDEPYMAEGVRDGLRLEAIAADIAGDGDSALALFGPPPLWQTPSSFCYSKYIILVKVLALNHLRVWVTG
jgi:hypothetical protein